MPAKRIRPDGWPSPSGYEYGYMGKGALLVTAGQMGVTAEGELAAGDFPAQFEQSLRNVVDVVAAAGGQAEDIVRLVVYLTDMPTYRASRAELGEIWRRVIGQSYPAMTVVEVKSLVRPEALVELEATAVLDR
ncbi:MAG TPA: RidA family protein [Anaerolineales bacterium]|jgi:enamine deaminase RidA (YjgF/YER057c/UK114 family)